MPVAEYELYKRIKLLGEGSFGKAYLVECVSDGALCVIKQVDLSKMSEQEKKDTLKEAKILEALRHPNIVRFREVYKTKKGKLCIVMDFADGGDLSNKVKERRGQHLSEAQILDWFTQICLGLKHVHDRKIIHRDLKGQNIFLTKSNIIKLGDFGIARVLTNTRDNARTMVGTPYYISPEIIENKPYSFKTDIWSLGVILYELCALKPPFNGDSLHFLALKIVRGAYNPIPTQYSKEMKTLVSQLLQTDPNKRPTTAGILAMPFIRDRIKNFLTETIRINEFAHTILHKQKINLNEIKMEDLKNVINEQPMPEHLVKQMKAQQQKDSENQQQKAPQQKENPPAPQQKEIFQPPPKDSNQNNLQKPPVPQQKPNNNPGDQKQQVVQNVIAKKEEEKQAQQQLAKQNYHYKNPNQPQLQPQQQVQQVQQQPPSSNRTPSADGRARQMEPAGKRSDQPNKLQNVYENQGPKIVSHQPDVQVKDIKANIPKEPENRNNLQNQKKPEQNANLNPNKWEKKPLPEPQYQHQQHQHVQPKQQQFDPFPDGKKEALKKPPMDPKKKPPIPEVKKPVDRELLGGGGLGGFENPNFAGNRNRKENHSRDAPRKRNESAERQNNPRPQQNVSSEKRAAPQLAKDNNQKNEAALQKIAEANLKRQKEDELRKHKQEEERLSKQADVDQKRIEKEKAREAQRAQMQLDIQKKRNQMKQGGGDIKVEFFGVKSPNDSANTEQSEETTDTQGSDNKRAARDVVSKKGSRNRSETPNQQKRKQWNAEPHNQASEPKKENKRLVLENPDANPKDELKDEFYVPAKSKEKNEKNVGAIEEDSASKEKKRQRNNAWSARNDKAEEVKEDIIGLDKYPGVNKQEEEEIDNYAALLQELNDIVNEPENLNKGSDSIGKNDSNVIEENDEDREDDLDDESSKGASKDSPLLKKNNQGSNGKQGDTPGEENLDFISDYQKLESLKIFMEDSLGDEIFMKAYHITKELFNKNANLEEIEQKYAKEDSYASLYPFIPSELRQAMPNGIVAQSEAFIPSSSEKLMP